MRTRSIVCGLALLAIAGWQASALAAETAAAPIVAAAASTRFALDEAAAEVLKATGLQVRISYGASGNFVRQIEQGAPFELFLSADEAFVTRLVKAGVARDEGAVYATGRLAVFAAHGSPLEPDAELKNLKTLVARGGEWRLAIANPETAPYGRAAREALTKLGLWNAVQPRLVIGEDISQAAQFATTGNAAGGIVAYSMVVVPEVAARGTSVLLAANLHEPLRQRMALLKNAGPTAQRFYEFLLSPGGQAIFVRHGFSAP